MTFSTHGALAFPSSPQHERFHPGLISVFTLCLVILSHQYSFYPFLNPFCTYSSFPSVCFPSFMLLAPPLKRLAFERVWVRTGRRTNGLCGLCDWFLRLIVSIGAVGVDRLSLSVSMGDLRGNRRRTPHWKRTQDRFSIPVKIPTEYVSLMPKLSKNANWKKFYRGTQYKKFSKSISLPWVLRCIQCHRTQKIQFIFN